MDDQLLKKYNIPVPRYTSYPPANFFKDTYTEADYLEAVEFSNGWAPQTISLYFHIPFCKKMCHYCGCHSCPMPDEQTVARYVEALMTEVKLVSRYIDKSRLVSQVHFGGGTPNVLPSACLEQIMDLVNKTFSFTTIPEMAIECNPAYLDRPYIQQLFKIGFNRFSLGIQDFDEQVLKGVNRDSSQIPVKDLITFLKDGRPDNKVNLDFIYGLPRQTVAGFVETIRKAIESKPDRIVTFSYAHVPWINKAQMILEESGLPETGEKIKMFGEASALLVKSGYKPIGLDHFVREEDELFQALKTGTLHRNFQGYCTRSTTGQVYAFGVSGISQLFGAYAQNTKLTGEYISSLRAGLVPIRKGYRLTHQETIIREVITEIMCNKQLNWGVIANKFSTTVAQIKSAVCYPEGALKELEEDGIIHLSDDHLEVTEAGGLFIRNVAALFDPSYTTGAQRFSRPV